MKTLILITALALTGCGTTQYEAYAKAQGDIAKANADAQTERYKALSKVAESGTDTARVAAVVALAIGGNSQSQPTQQVQAPQNEALAWASILAPTLTNIASMAVNAKVAAHSADNAARVAESTNATFAAIAGKIQAPVTVVPQPVNQVVAAPVLPQANVTTTTSTNTTDNHAVTNTTSASTTNTMSNSTGVLGSGSYTVTPTPVIVTPVVTTPPVIVTPTVTPTVNPVVITPVVQIVPVVPK